MIDFSENLKNQRIFITGNTGFTGGWACFWLQSIGAKLLGFSLPPSTSPSLFNILRLNKTMKTIFGDVCNYDLIEKSIFEFQPDLILHLAAQPLVSNAYDDPLETMKTNVMGTTNILEVSRNIKSLKGVLCITTDKVYKNIQGKKSFTEDDIIGGIDPYSASKSAAEIIIESYAKSFFKDNKVSPIINVARGGNIIGGGDWSNDRLIPDYVKAINSKTIFNVRSLHSIRPWQHVLDLISGYFLIFSHIVEGKINKFDTWNLGPHEKSSYTVQNVLEMMMKLCPNPKIAYIENHIEETKTLDLNSNKAKEILNWETSWNIETSIKKTLEWYNYFYLHPKKMCHFTTNQISQWKNINF